MIHRISQNQSRLAKYYNENEGRPSLRRGILLLLTVLILSSSTISAARNQQMIKDTTNQQEQPRQNNINQQLRKNSAVAGEDGTTFFDMPTGSSNNKGAMKAITTSKFDSNTDSEPIPNVQELRKKLRTKQLSPSSSSSPSGRTAVVHVGPLKTGSTSIQNAIKALRMELNMDNYNIPTEWGDINMGGIRDCYVLGHVKDDTCEPELVNSILEMGETTKYNLVLTAESFSFPETNIATFKQSLIPYWSNIIIVMYYRRYYDWLYSSWNQLYKYDNYNKRISFVDYMTDIYSSSKKIENQFWNSHYTYSLASRWKGFFDHVKVYNMHDESYMTNTEKFFCEAIPNATNTCSELQYQLSMHGEERYNKGKDLIYKDLAYIAITERIIPPPSGGVRLRLPDLPAVADVLQYQQEVIWKKSKYDFIPGSIRCLDDDILADLYEKTAMAERELFPTFFGSSNGEEQLQAQFTADQSTLLCSIDAKIVLQQDPQWQEFLQSDTNYYQAAADYTATLKSRNNKKR